MMELWPKPTYQEQLLYSAAHRARAKGVEHSITADDIVIPDVCPVLGMKLVRHRGSSGARSNSPSIDRIDPTKGYVKGNVQVISHLANRMKNNATPAELKRFAFWVYKTYL